MASCCIQVAHSIFLAGAIYLVEFNCHFSLQVQYLMSCIQVAQSVFVAGAVFGEVQVSLFVAGMIFGMIVGARNVVFFNTKCAWEARQVTSVAGLRTDGFMLGSHAWIMLRTVSDRLRIVHDISAVFSKFLSDFGTSLLVAGTVFGDVAMQGDSCMLLPAT